MRGSKLISLLLLLIFAAVFCELAFCDWNPEDGHKMHFPQEPNPDGWDVCLCCQWIADDFTCSRTGPIDDIHFWISWMGDEIGEVPPDLWEISIFDDAGGVPGNWLWTLHGANVVIRGPYQGWQGWVCPSPPPLVLYPDHQQYFQVNVTEIVEPLIQEEGTTYWLVIRANIPPMPSVGWKTSFTQYQAPAMWSLDPFDPASWRAVRETVDEIYDMAFVITGREEEEPKHDLGDAPDSTNNHGVAMDAYPLVQANFPTVYGTGSPPHGPIHWDPRGVAYLGSSVTLENEADLMPDQDGIVNIDPPNNDPDNDGADDSIHFPLVLPHCIPTTFDYDVTVTVAAGADVYVNAWADWTRDGDWDDSPPCSDDIIADEWIVQNQLLTFTSGGTFTVTTPQFYAWHPPGTTEVIPFWLRITLSDRPYDPIAGVDGYGGAGPVDGYSIGETEDFLVEEYDPGQGDLDFGDAPEGGTAYPSTGVIGQYPTCITVGLAGWIQHGLCWAHFGPGFDFEIDGNGGLCPNCFPPYDQDECFNDGDAGLLFPPAYTIVGGAVVPCDSSATPAPLGVVCTTAMWGVNVDIDVNNGMPVDGFVNVLMDWDQNGKWGGVSSCATAAAPEHVLVNFPVPMGFAGPLSALNPPPFLIGPNSGYVWTRFTISESPVPDDWTGEGVFEDGESEDYLLEVIDVEEELDFGDAPDSPAGMIYPTLLPNGARHVIVPGILLGTSIDPEADGQPDATATGDDNDGNDDEDGVKFLTKLIPGKVAKVDVTASTGGHLTGNLNLWIDYNGDNSWAEAGDHVFNDLSIGPGTTTLSFTVPATATPGIVTFARFRFTSPNIVGLGYSGYARDGEVEDYEVKIDKEAIKWSQPPTFSDESQYPDCFWGWDEPSVYGGVGLWFSCWNIPTQCHGDADGDGIVWVNDLSILNAAFGSTYPNPPYDPCADFDRDLTVGPLDLTILNAWWGMQPPADCPIGIAFPIVADDWLCESSYPVTDIHWWGSYLRWMEDMPPDSAPDAFHIGIWTDVPAGADNPWSHPGVMIWEYIARRDEVWERPVGCDFHPDYMEMPDTCFRYDLHLPEKAWFYQEEPDTIYWISISAIYATVEPPDEFVWGWKTRMHYFNDDAVRIFDPTAPVVGMSFIFGEPIYDFAGNSWDLAFELTTLHCKGDFNDSGTVTSTDITLLVNYWLAHKNLLGIAPLGLSGYVPGMDLNGSGTITSTDITILVNHWLSTKNILGIAPCMP